MGRRFPKRSQREHLNEAMPCYYCGLPASSIDHCIPVSLQRALMSVDAEVSAAVRARLPKTYSVPSCQQCNSSLGDRVFDTMKERKAAVKVYLRSRYARLLETPDWDEEELKHMGYSMRRLIENRMAQKRQIRQRIAW